MSHPKNKQLYIKTARGIIRFIKIRWQGKNDRIPALKGVVMKKMVMTPTY
jgi:hypothetical protein